MAASLSRPDPTSPSSIAEAGFSVARRGFSQDEVRAFLVSVGAELRRLHERERELEAELRAARASAPGRPELDDDTVAALLGEETVRVLQTARESATQIKARAEEHAARAMRDAHDEANRVRQEADIDAARKRQDAQAEAESEVALAKQEGREMVNEARAYRERVLADLERRTKLARQHIDELNHGRERLLQVFERARLVAVDVTAELQAFAGPEEFVNFSPTTGPVPLVVPASQLDARPAARTRPFDDESSAADEIAADDVPLDDSDLSDADGPDPEVFAAEVFAAESVDAESVDAVTDLVDDGPRAEAAPSPAGTAEAAQVVDAPDVVDDVQSADSGIESPDAGDDTRASADQAATTGGEGAPVAATARTNVVALFPGREQPADPGRERGDVDDLFARLRSSVPAPDDEPAAAEPAEPAAAEPAAAEPADHEPAEPVAAVAAPSTPFARRDEAIVPLIITAARKLKRVLADEQNGVLDTLRGRDRVTALDALVPALDAHVASYAASIADELAAAAAAGAVEIGGRDTATLRRTLEKSGALDSARALLRTDLVAPLRDRIERSISEGHGDNEAITKRVRAVYREWKTQHIDDQLDDVFRYAFGGGVAASIEPGTPLTWRVDPTHAACADCEDNSLAGVVASGEPFPTGHASAPSHSGCRCLALPADQ
jgi:cell division septum initiation protein DivIVA